MAKPVTKVETTRTSAGLCNALFDELDLLRNGDSDAHRAGAVAKLAIQIISTKRLEIDASQLLKGGASARPVLFEGRPLPLGK